MANNQCVVLAAREPTRKRIRNWLTQLGYDAVFVNKPAELMAHPNLAACPLVVLHVNAIETLDACTQLRSRVETALLPQVVLADNETWRHTAYEMGVDAVF